MKISNIYAQETRDSRKKPTVEVFVEAGEHKASFSVPSGASTGIHEAWELRDNDGGVNKAISHVNRNIKNALLGVDPTKQREVDKIIIELDGTANKNNLGGNAMIGVSIAVAKVAAKVKNISLVEHLHSLGRLNTKIESPRLYSNLINGGSHANTRLKFQEYMVVPKTKNPKESLEIIRKIDNELKEIINKKFPETPTGDEGGYALDVEDIFVPLDLLEEASKKVGLNEEVDFAIDVASSSFYEKGEYLIAQEKLNKEDLIEIYIKMIEKFPIVSIEDPLNEEDFRGFNEILEKAGDVLIVGDDLTVTNKERLDKAIKNKSVSALIIKPNQIGTLSETIETIELAKEHDVKCIVSHRSGETKDDFIADLSVAFGCFGIKAGSPKAEERLVKYNRLIEITN